MRLLYVTSFNQDLYRATGRRLIESFLRTRSDGALLLCHEEGAGEEWAGDPRILRYDLDSSQVLRSWLAVHIDLIPESLGGTAGPCDCAARDQPFGPHRAGCHWFWFNRNASRWFRKLVALDYAQGLNGCDAVIWLDSDCRFKKRLPAAVVAEWYGGAAVFFHKSTGRRVLESGVLGIRTQPAGRRFLRLTLERFVSGEFRCDERWDDGFQFQKTLDRHPEIAAVDLAVRATGGTFVLPNSPAGEYLGHDKGVHRRRRLMV